MEEPTPGNLGTPRIDLDGWGTGEGLEKDDVDLDSLRFIKHQKVREKPGEVIAKLACSRFYAGEETAIDDLAGELDSHPEISSLGVVDDKRRVRGIIIRTELFDILGKPYGRDVYKKKPVSKVVREVRAFFEETNILTVADELKEELRDVGNRYYILVNSRDEYTGVFSTKNILLYLSEVTQKDLALAQRLQRSIVKETEYVRGKRFELIAVSRMAKEVGGDFYTVRKGESDRWIIALCDVSGKGVAASLITSILGGMFDAFDFRRGLKAFAKTLNAYICEHFQFERFITGAIMALNDATGELSICDMGHSHLYLCDGGRMVKLKTDPNNVPIGISPDVDPVVNAFTVQSGNMLVVFTDGIIEQNNAEGEEFSLPRFGQIVLSSKDMDLKAVRDRVLAELDRFRQSTPQHDDLTFLVLRYTP